MSGFPFSVCLPAAWRELSLSPLLLFPSLVSLWLSGLWVGKIWCCGNFYGHHQWGRAFSCSNMTGSQAARRHRSLVSNLWKGKDHIKQGGFFFLTYRKLWAGKIVVVFLGSSVSFSRWYGKRKKRFLFHLFPGVSVVFNSDRILVDGIFISTAITVGVLKYSLMTQCVCAA